MMDISDERLGDLWRMPDHYMRPISFARAVLALQERADVAPLPVAWIANGDLELLRYGMHAIAGKKTAADDIGLYLAAAQDSAKGGKIE